MNKKQQLFTLKHSKFARSKQTKCKTKLHPKKKHYVYSTKIKIKAATLYSKKKKHPTKFKFDMHEKWTIWTNICWIIWWEVERRKPVKRCEQHDKVLQQLLKNSSSKRKPMKRKEEYHRKIARNPPDCMMRSREKE